MKRTISLSLALVMVVVMALSLASCSNYGKIEKNFTAAEYTVVDTTDEDGKEKLSFVAHLNDEGKISCTTHILKKGLNYAVILEFGANEDAKKALENYMKDDDVKAFVKDLDSTKLVNGNCVLIPVTINLVSISKNINEMIDLFNK